MKKFLCRDGSVGSLATLRIRRGRASGVAGLAAVLGLLASAHSQSNPGTYEVLHAFTGPPDGGNPTAGLLRDAQGNLYGTTSGGGNNSTACDNGRCGVVFKIDSAGNETVLYRFNGAPDGANPEAGLIQDSAGNLYGTTSGGGTSGQGTVFKIDTSGNETLLYSFRGQPDGASPHAGLVLDAAGDFYGTTNVGGATSQGTIFKLDSSGKETVLYSFTGQADGRFPRDLLRDSAGNLYGTAYSGGVLNCVGPRGITGFGCGTVFKLDTTGSFSVVYSFLGWNPTKDGGQPVGGLVADVVGNLYGATLHGGSGGCQVPVVGSTPQNILVGCGTVFKLDTTGVEIALHSFTGGGDGSFPLAGLMMDASGNLYGTTSSNIFKLDTSGNLTVLFDFTGGADGGTPQAPLLRDSAGNLYGTASSGRGLVFELPAAPSPVFNVVTTMSGTGTGTIVSNPGGINCPPVCISAFPVGTTVGFTATPTGGSTFGGWSDNCATTSANVCTVNSTEDVNAAFSIPPPPDFTVSASPLTPVTVSPGSASSSTIDTAAIGSFSGSITLSCAVQSSVALAPTCSVSPASVSVGTPSTLTVITTGPTASMVSPFGSGLPYATWMPVLGLLAGGTSLLKRHRTQKFRLRFACLLLAGSVFQLGCGAGSSVTTKNNGTPAGNYSVVVTAVSGSLQHSVNPNPTLTVQ